MATARRGRQRSSDRNYPHNTCFMKKKLFSALTALCLASASTYAADPFQLIIDISDLSNVTITTTGETPAYAVATPFYNGITLNNFITEPSVGDFGGINGYLKPARYNYDDNRLSQFDLYSRNLILSNSSATGEDTTMYFSNLEAAFTGVGTLDFSNIMGIATFASSGDIYAAGLVIGQYQVVPEPSSMAFGVIGLAGALLARRRGSRK